MTSKQIVGGIVGIVATVSTVLIFNSKTVQVPCLINKFDTTVETLHDTTTVHYISGYDTVYRKWNKKKIKSITPIYSDSFKISNRDTMIIIDNSYMGLCDSIVNDTIAQVPMAYGLWIQDPALNIQQKIDLAKSVGVTIFKTTVNLSSYTGGINSALKTMTEQGIRSNLVVSWNGKQNGLFVRDTAAFRSKLKMFLAANKNYNFFAVIEDEVVSDGFFVDTLQYYVNELKISVEECHNAGIECTNSGDHIEIGLALANGVPSHNDNDKDVAFLLNAYKTIPIDYLNLHNGSEETLSDFTKAVNYMKAASNISKVIMNAHVFKQGDPNILKTWVPIYKDAGFLLFMPFSGSGNDKAPPFNVAGTINLTEWGNIYKEIIINN